MLEMHAGMAPTACGGMTMANYCIFCGEEIPDGIYGSPIRQHRTNYSKKRYSVYYKNTDMPLIIYASAKECAKAMGITIDSFYRYIVFTRRGNRNIRKWAVYEDEVGDDE